MLLRPCRQSVHKVSVLYLVFRFIFLTMIMFSVSTKTLGSHLGTGGMETKLIAAEIATEAGVSTVICSSKHPERILDIIDYNKSLKPLSSTPTTPREPLSGRTSPEPTASSSSLPSTPDDSSQERTPGPHHCSLPATPIRPPHTLFTPSSMPMRDLKSWTSHTLWPAGSIIIDAGAHSVLSRRESGGRLLPAGVVGVIGTFASGQAVRVVIRRRVGGAQEPAYQASTFTQTSMTYANDSPVSTEPGTPALHPAASLTSSISTIEHLPRALSIDVAPAGHHSPMLSTWEDDSGLDGKDDIPPHGADWEIFEVGRGLASYNSAQIRRVRGAKRYGDNYLPGMQFAHNSTHVLVRTFHTCLDMPTLSMLWKILPFVYHRKRSGYRRRMA